MAAAAAGVERGTAPSLLRQRRGHSAGGCRRRRKRRWRGGRLSGLSRRPVRGLSESDPWLSPFLSASAPRKTFPQHAARSLTHILLPSPHAASLVSSVLAAACSCSSSPQPVSRAGPSERAQIDPPRNSRPEGGGEGAPFLSSPHSGPPKRRQATLCGREGRPAAGAKAVASGV